MAVVRCGASADSGVVAAVLVVLYRSVAGSVRVMVAGASRAGNSAREARTSDIVDCVEWRAVAAEEGRCLDGRGASATVAVQPSAAVALSRD